MLITDVLQNSIVIRETEWCKQFMTYQNGVKDFNAAAAEADLIAHLKVSVIPNSNLIEVRFSCPSPKDSKTIVGELVNQHVNDQRLRSSARALEDSQGLESLKDNYLTEIHTRRVRCLRIAKELESRGISIGAAPAAKDVELQQLISERIKNLAEQDNAEAALALLDEQAKNEAAADRDDASRKEQAARRATLSDTSANAAFTLKRIDERIKTVSGEISSAAAMKAEYNTLQNELATYLDKANKVQDQQDQIGLLMNSGHFATVDWSSHPDLPNVRD